jgi:hypothetical protein
MFSSSFSGYYSINNFFNNKNMVTLTEQQALIVSQLLWDTIRKLDGISTAKTRIKELKQIRIRITKQLTINKTI